MCKLFEDLFCLPIDIKNGPLLSNVGKQLKKNSKFKIMYEFKINFNDDDSDWEACDVISKISSDTLCTVVSRRDGRMVFVKRENVRFLGATLAETKRKRKKTI